MWPASGGSLVDDSAEVSDDAGRSEGRRQEVVADRTSVIGDVLLDRMLADTLGLSMTWVS
jgi:hypothetical protein